MNDKNSKPDDEIEKLRKRLNELFTGQWEGIQKIIHELAEIKSEVKKLSEKIK